MNKKLLAGVFTLLFCASVAFLYYLLAPYVFIKEAKITTYEIQIGTELNDETPGVLDSGKKFKNLQPLKVVAIYNATRADAANFNGEARIYITEQNDTKILQDHVVDEYPYIAGFDMELDNLAWGKGKYVAHFARNGKEVATKEFELK